MIEDDGKDCLVYSMPTEVLLYIFTFLPAQQMQKCRQVCLRWKQIIDSLVRNDGLWRNHCKFDFADIYKVARCKARPGLLWFHIYRSLSLWPMLRSATESRDEFASASNVNEQIRNFKILQNGVLGVHKRSGIVYYDINTLEKSTRVPISGDYVAYDENEDTIVIMNDLLQLFIMRKIVQNPRYETNITFDNVKQFLLVDREVYYVTSEDEIYLCKLDDINLKSTLIGRCEDAILTLGYTNNHLNVLTFQKNIYIANKNNLVLLCSLHDLPNLLHQLHVYDFLERIDWRIYTQWMYVLNQSIPEGSLCDILIVRTYGDVVFVGSDWGVLRVYYAPYTNGELNINSAEPIKQYNFMERCDCPVLSLCPIIHVDVIESEDGHTVVVAMPKKIAVLKFAHSFKRSAIAAMLPYNQDVKLLKLDEHV